MLRAGPSVSTPSWCPSQRRFALLATLAIGVGFALRDVAHAPASVGLGDQAELQFLAWKLGLPHCNGYPVYIWLGWLLSRIPVGEPAFRVTALSGLCGGGALAMLFRIASREARRAGPLRWMIAGAIVLVAANAEPFLQASRIAEMYTLQWLLTLVALDGLLLWSATRRPRFLWQGMAALGIACGNHVTTAILLGAAAVLCLAHAGDRARRRQLYRAVPFGVAVAIAASFGLFWTLWARHLDFDFWRTVILPNAEKFGLHLDPPPGPLDSWLFSVSCSQAHKDVFGTDLQSLARPLLSRAVALARFLGPVGLACAAMGFVRSWRKWRPALMLSVLFVVQWVLVALETGTLKRSIYFFVPELVALLWCACGAAEVVRALQRWIRAEPAAVLPDGATREPLLGSRKRGAAAAVLIALACVAQVAVNLALRDAARRNAKEHGFLLEEEATPTGEPTGDTARAILAALPTRAIAFAPWNHLWSLHYIAALEDRPDGLVLFESNPETPLDDNAPLSPAYRSILDNVDGPPVFYLIDTPSPPFSSYRWSRQTRSILEQQR